VDRLYRTVAMRQLGLPLKDIATALDGGDLRSVVELTRSCSGSGGCATATASI
jgi:hypothetical protein